MSLWPFPHNWSAVYSRTLSFLTTVLVSQSGREQRIAERGEPRRTITTEVLRDGSSARSFDRFLWATQAGTFDHVDPINGSVSLVRLADTQSVAHPAAFVASASVTLAVEPGTDALVYAEPDADDSFSGRYVFPFAVNWSAGRGDDMTLPRRTADFNRGRIAVTRPVAFASRTGSALLLRVGQYETDALESFFVAMRGRQGEFWTASLLDDMAVLETVSSTLVVDGRDAAAMYQADTVNAAVELHLWGGGVYRRRIIAAAVSGDTTLLQMSDDLPEDAPAIRLASWMRVSRFASDDLTVEWTTSTVAQSQVQTLSLPYAAPDVPLFDDDTGDLLDYFGSDLFYVFGDPLDFVVNIQIPRLSGDIELEQWWWDGLQTVMNGSA